MFYPGTPASSPPLRFLTQRGAQAPPLPQASLSPHPPLPLVAPSPSEERKRRLAAGGQLTVLDRLFEYPQHRDEQVWGLARLLAFASVNVGYPKKGNIQRKAALAALHGLKAFPRDPEILSSVFFLLGWTLVGPAQDHVRKILNQVRGGWGSR